MVQLFNSLMKFIFTVLKATVKNLRVLILLITITTLLIEKKYTRTTTIKMKSRTIAQKILSIEQSEGLGALVRRSIGRREIQRFDPFLMLDEFKVGLPGGFPDHPHRGFETVTYLLPSSKGNMLHEDFVGHKGELKPGDLQWMTPGKGILHSEMPASKIPAHGLQLWVNLPKKLKMIEPKYQELSASKLPQIEENGVKAIVIAGEALGITSPVYTNVPTHYAHFFMKPNSVLNHKIRPTFNTFLYTIKGSGKIAGEFVDAHHVVTLNRNGEGILVETNDNQDFEFVIISGEPIGETVAQYGPFVMNSHQELMDTLKDYQQERNGFENAQSWSSEIADLGY